MKNLSKLLVVLLLMVLFSACSESSNGYLELDEFKVYQDGQPVDVEFSSYPENFKSVYFSNIPPKKEDAPSFEAEQSEFPYTTKRKVALGDSIDQLYKNMMAWKLT